MNSVSESSSQSLPTDTGEQKISPELPKQRSKSSLLIITAIIILLVISGIAFAVYSAMTGFGRSCEYKGETYAINDPVPSGDSCNSCSCTYDEKTKSGQVSCTLIECGDEVLDSTADWEEYVNEEYGFAIEHPADFQANNLYKDALSYEIASPYQTCTYDQQPVQVSNVQFTFLMHKGISYETIWKDVFGFDLINAQGNNFDGKTTIGQRGAYYFSQGAEMLFGRTAYLVNVSPTTALEINTYIPAVGFSCPIELASPNENNVVIDKILSTFRFLDEEEIIESAVTGSIEIYRLEPDGTNVEVNASSSAGVVTDMMLWTDNRPSSDWQQFMPGVLFFEPFETVYVQYRDDKGNVSEVYSDSIYPKNSPPSEE